MPVGICHVSCSLRVGVLLKSADLNVFLTSHWHWHVAWSTTTASPSPRQILGTLLSMHLQIFVLLVLSIFRMSSSSRPQPRSSGPQYIHFRSPSICYVCKSIYIHVLVVTAVTASPRPKNKQMISRTPPTCGWQLLLPHLLVRRNTF